MLWKAEQHDAASRVQQQVTNSNISCFIIISTLTGPTLSQGRTSTKSLQIAEEDEDDKMNQNRIRATPNEVNLLQNPKNETLEVS